MRALLRGPRRLLHSGYAPLVCRTSDEHKQTFACLRVLRLLFLQLGTACPKYVNITHDGGSHGSDKSFGEYVYFEDTMRTTHWAFQNSIVRSPRNNFVSLDAAAGVLILCLLEKTQPRSKQVQECCYDVRAHSHTRQTLSSLYPATAARLPGSCCL